jgi:hypothetical protein
MAYGNTNSSLAKGICLALGLPLMDNGLSNGLSTIDSIFGIAVASLWTIDHGLWTEF